MAAVLLKRLGRGFVTLVLLIIFTFASLRLAGDPALQLLGPEASMDQIESLRAELGLDQSILEQFRLFVASLLRGDLGMSYVDSRPVTEVIAERLPATLSLTGAALVVMLVVGLFIGIGSAVQRGQRFDQFANVLISASFATPNFFFGVLLILLFSVWLGWLPTHGNDSWRHYILPVLTIATSEAAIIARFTRGSVLETLGRPFVMFSRSKGLPERKVLWRHVLPNSAAPILTILALLVGSMVGGAVITETVFGWPGMGQLLVSSMRSRDLATVQGIVILVGVVMILANLTVDLIILALDPRQRQSEAK